VTILYVDSGGGEQVRGREAGGGGGVMWSRQRNGEEASRLRAGRT
jgi:hypothetical protein